MHRSKMSVWTSHVNMIVHDGGDSLPQTRHDFDCKDEIETVSFAVFSVDSIERPSICIILRFEKIHRIIRLNVQLHQAC